MTRIEAQQLVKKVNDLKGKTVPFNGKEYLVIDFRMVCHSEDESSGLPENCRVEAILENTRTGKREATDLKNLVN